MRKRLRHVLFLCMLLMGCNEHFYNIREDCIVMCLNDPSAEHVELYCSFDGFRPRPARKVNFSTWEVVLPRMDEFSYFYRVDGAVMVPECTLFENDDFGSKNCILLDDI